MGEMPIRRGVNCMDKQTGGQLPSAVAAWVLALPEVVSAALEPFPADVVLLFVVVVAEGAVEFLPFVN